MKIDWRNIEQVIKRIEKKIEKDENAGFYRIANRHEMVKYRLKKESHANKTIYYFGGDFVAESYSEYPGLKNLPEIELKLLKKARERGVDVKILARWDESSPKLTYTIRRYVDEGVPIRKWSGSIRGGIYGGICENDKIYDEMYVIQRQLSVPPSELTAEKVEELPQKVLGEPQRDEDVGIESIVTNSKPLVK